ncbi:MAG: DNA gyrase modulator [Desulfurococcaceae archaeon]
MSAVELSNALLKALSKLYDEVAVVVVENEKTMVKLWNTELSVVQTWTETEINLRLAKSRRLWTVYLSARDPLYVVKSAEEIVKLADRIEEAELYAPLPEPGECDPLEDAYDVNVEALMKDPSKPVEAMVDEALSNGAERVAGTLTLAKTSRVLLTSKGFQCTEKTTSIEAYIRAFKGEFSGH